MISVLIAASSGYMNDYEAAPGEQTAALRERYPNAYGEKSEAERASMWEEWEEGASDRKDKATKRKHEMNHRAATLRSKDMCVHRVKVYSKEGRMACRWCDPKKLGKE